MKKTIIIIAFILLLGSQAIANGFSELNLRVNKNIPLKVIIDGQLVSKNATVVDIKKIPFGNHSLQVYRFVNDRYNHHYEEIIFNGDIYLPPNTVTVASIKQGRFIVQNQFAINVEPQNVIYNYQGPNHIPPRPNYWTEEPHFPPQLPPTVCEVYEPAIQYVPEPIIEVFPMLDNDFGTLKETINNQWFSDEKIMVLKQAIRSGHLFTTNQVKELVSLYSFSADKLAIAKIIYKNTIDQENYYTVFNALHWNSSKQELSNYIASL